MNPDGAIIEVRDLVTHYGDTAVLRDISFDVQRGEIFVIIGGSGCGKTTLLKHMTGLLQPTSGSILHGDDDITRMDEESLARLQRRLGIAFQFGGLLNSMSIGDNVALPLREYSGLGEDLISGIVRLKLALVGLSDTADLIPGELSGGMRKRAGLARALALDPPVVFFDEPSAGLDPITASGLDDLILTLNKLLGTTFIIVTHELESIRKIADRVIMLDKGEITFMGTVEEASEHGSARVRQFFAREADEFINQR